MASASDRATGSNIKIERAKTHVRELEALVQEFLQSSPYAVVREEDPETGDLVYRLRVLRQPPLAWSAIVGDAVHNLRTALDLLACELVRANGGRVNEDTGFPIGKDVHALKSMLKNKIGGASEEAIRHIRSLNPYPGGNDGLWRLHRLDVVDKHRLLLSVGSAHKNIVLDAVRMFPPDTPEFLGIDVGTFEAFSLPFALTPADRQWPLSDGAEVLRVMAAAREGHWDEAPQFGFEIAFGEGEVVRGQPLLETLHRFIALVEGVVEQLGPLLEQDGSG